MKKLCSLLLVVGGLATGGVFGGGVQDFAQSAMSPPAGTTKPVEDFSEALNFKMPTL